LAIQLKIKFKQVRLSMNQELEKKTKKEVTHSIAEQLIDSGNAYSPNVDILVDDNVVVFAVDLPGVAKGEVNIEITENDTIVIKAKNSHIEPENPLFCQYGVGNFYRVFQISNELDKDQVKVHIENGLLEIRVQKREEMKPRKIAIIA
jgi:HSP20 family molecular chaperone IbpA